MRSTHALAFVFELDGWDSLHDVSGFRFVEEKGQFLSRGARWYKNSHLKLFVASCVYQLIHLSAWVLGNRVCLSCLQSHIVHSSPQPVFGRTSNVHWVSSRSLRYWLTRSSIRRHCRELVGSLQLRPTAVWLWEPANGEEAVGMGEK